MQSTAVGWLGASALATAGYAAMSTVVAKRKTSTEDRKARREILRHSTKRAKKLAEATGHIGKWYTLVPLALASAAWLAKEERYAAAVTIAGAALGAATLSPVLDRVMKFRQPPPGKKDPTAQSYPSGHALETTSVFIPGAWVLAREGLVNPWIAAPVAVVASVVSGAGRLILDRHWSTDSAAGYCAGIALGSACAGLYEITSRWR